LSAPSGALVIALFSIQSEKYGKQLKFAEQARCFYFLGLGLTTKKVGCTKFFHQAMFSLWLDAYDT